MTIVFSIQHTPHTVAMMYTAWSSILILLLKIIINTHIVNVTGFAKTCHICTQWQRTLLSPIDSSINKLTNYHNTTAKGLPVCFFLRLVSEACQMPINFWMFIELHWLACAGSHLTESPHLTHS